MARTTKGRIVESSDPKVRLDRAAKIYAKVLEEGTTGKLTNLEEGRDWTVIGPQIETALGYHNQAEKLKGQMEEAYRLRDLIVVEVDDIEDYSKNLLKGIYQDNPKRLAEYGWEVDDTPQVKKTKSKTP